MLRAISISGHMLFITVDAAEYRDLDLPDGLLADAELAEVRGVRPSALPGYVTFKPEVIADEQDQL